MCSFPLLLQGRSLTQETLQQIRTLIADHPHWHRQRISVELAKAWNWRNPIGRLKDMAARTLLLKLHRRGHIVLPPPTRPAAHRRSLTHLRIPLESSTAPIAAALSQLLPLSLQKLTARNPDYPIFCHHLAHYHYLGYRGPVGEHLAYLARDRYERLLACVLFGAAAWKTQARDQFIGWDHAMRAGRLHLLTNNTRFLILPWVRVPHLASHLLGRILRRLSSDWQAKYGHPIHLVETFVERDRFQGTCYRAANWTRVGKTQGRGRQDRAHRLRVPIKDIYLYPLTPCWREELCRWTVDEKQDASKEKL
jgi:hypothetical protein